MYRRFLLLLALVVLVGLGTSAFAAALPDTVGTPFETAFSYLGQKGVVQGYSDGRGRPNSTLNRAEALKVLMGIRHPGRVSFYQSSMPPYPLFTDIDQGAWYAPYIEAGYEQRLITGYPDDTFRPANQIQVEEAIAMTLRAYGISGNGSQAAQSAYIQNRAGEWFTPYINESIQRNLVMHLGSLTLGSPITRGQFFDIVYRLDSIIASGSALYTGPEPQGNLGSFPTTSGSTGQISAGQPSTNQGAVLSSHPYASEKYFAITMPDLGVSDLTITHPQDAFTSDGVLSVLANGVGHLFSYPGGGGKIMIYGHSSGYPWDVSQYTKIFRQVNKLAIGNRLYVTYDGKLHTYEVTHKQTIDAADTTPFNDDGTGEELILYTCWPPDSIAQRYLVHALPVESVALR